MAFYHVSLVTCKVIAASSLQIEQFVPPEEIDLNQMTGRQERILKECIDKLAERVHNSIIMHIIIVHTSAWMKNMD